MTLPVDKQGIPWWKRRPPKWALSELFSRAADNGEPLHLVVRELVRVSRLTDGELRKAWRIYQAHKDAIPGCTNREEFVYWRMAVTREPIAAPHRFCRDCLPVFKLNAMIAGTCSHPETIFGWEKEPVTATYRVPGVWNIVGYGSTEEMREAGAIPLSDYELGVACDSDGQVEYTFRPDGLDNTEEDDSQHQ